MKSPVFQKIARLLLGAVLLLCLVPASVSAADFAASVTVGETVTPCVTLQEAITAAQSAPGSTVTVLQDVTVDNTIVISSGTFTLDLNGCTVECLSGSYFPIAVDNSAVSLIVEDTSATQTGTLKGPCAICVTINCGHLTINGGNFVGTMYEGVDNVNGTVVINGGNIYGSSYGILTCSGGSVTVNGGNISGGQYDLFTVQNSNIDHKVVTLNGGVFSDGITLQSSWQDLNDMLGTSCLYFDEDENFVFPADGSHEDATVYTVKKYVVATVTTDGGTTEYPVLSWAVAAAEATPGSILKLQMDQALTAELPINTGGFTFDLNGHSLSAPQNALNIGAGASLILTDSGDTKGSAGTVASAGSVTLRGDVNLTSQQAELILKNNARLYLDGLTGTDTYTVELLDASGAFATGEFGSRADGSTVDAATAARFTSIQDPYYVVQVNADGCLEVAPAAVELTAEIVWIDGNDADGVRPDSVTVTVSLDGATAATQSVSSGKHTFILPKYDGTTELSYSLSAPDVTGYEKQVDGTTYTYTLITEHSGTVQWDDDNDRDGIRPDSVTLDLLDENGEIAATVTAYAKDGWEYTVQVAKYGDASLHTYRTALSTPLPGYTDANGVLTHKSETGSISVKLVWDDGDNADRLRPDTVNIDLKADGVRQTALAANAANQWTAAVEVPRYRDGGQTVAYTLDTVSVKDYTATVTGDAGTGFTVTLTHTPRTNGSAQTGDHALPGLWLTLAVLSLCGSALLLQRKRTF